MPAYRTPDGLERLRMLLAALRHEIRIVTWRRRVAAIKTAIFGMIFIGLVIAETLFAALMFALISVQILGTSISGAAFALLVPTVIGAAHVKLHHEGDHFTRWWLKRLSSIGILVFVLGISLMVGFSAWQAAQDAVTAISSGPSGSFGNTTIDQSNDESTSAASWVGIIPNAVLFLGLSFGMIITVAFASFCLGRALEGFNLLTETPPVSPQMKAACDTLTADMKALSDLRDEDQAARWRMPIDPKHGFAREAYNVCWTVSQKKLAAARRKFDPARLNDPLASAFEDKDVGSIPTQFIDEASFARHMAEQMDRMRIHNLLRILSGLPETPKS